MKKIWLKFYTFVLLCLPLGIYIFILKKCVNTRLKDYSGVVGNNPICYPVFYDTVLIDLSRLKI